jgi:hypothetical protein
MAIPESLKFDVRVRERLLKKGLITEAEVEQHLAGLPDRAEDALDIGIKQPALQTEAEREVIVVRTLARPAQPAPPPRMFGDDDDFEDEKPARAASAGAIDDDDLDDDDEDEDEDDEDEDEDKAKAKEEGEAKKEEPAAKVDDDWG